MLDAQNVDLNPLSGIHRWGLQRMLRHRRTAIIIGRLRHRTFTKNLPTSVNEKVRDTEEAGFLTP